MREGEAPIPLAWRVRATLAATVIPPLLEVVSLSRLAQWVDTRVRSGLGNRPPDNQALADYVSRLLYRLPRPWRHTCLRRSAVLYYLLRKSGCPVGLRIGVRKEPDTSLAAHAWLVRDGEPYLEPDRSHPERFKVIAQFPLER